MGAGPKGLGRRGGITSGDAKRLAMANVGSFSPSSERSERKSWVRVYVVDMHAG